MFPSSGRRWLLLQDHLIAIDDRRAVAGDPGRRDRSGPHLVGNRITGVEILDPIPIGHCDCTTAGEVDACPHAAEAVLLLELREMFLLELLKRRLDPLGREPWKHGDPCVHGSGLLIVCAERTPVEPPPSMDSTFNAHDRT